MTLDGINPYIRLVNNYSADYSHIQRERIIYDFEFIYILGGTLTMYYNEKKYDLKKSDLFYIKPGVKNHMETYARENKKTHCMPFDWQRCKPYEGFDVKYIDKLKKRRIEEAKLLLLGSKMCINEISDKLGYSNAFYFSKCFKNLAGYSPTQYRNLV